ncbi:hypothetical protein [Metalysinibacillus jejuensis]|uniref:hypothetical protein n=1 Tax=Metalysinibacillus jejuensis TaxID=914327 RepID=UPI000D36F72F|nr:hypothetical protein [Metalysinibacillus jejuensis]
MEPLVFLIIAAVVSAIIDKSKKKEQQSPKPTPVQKVEPTAPPVKQERPVAMPKPLFPTEKRPTFEEFAREILGELEPKAPAEPKPAPILEPQPEPVMESVTRVRESMQERMEKSSVVDTTVKPIEVVRKSPKHQDLIQAVIMSEVLGQPKSRKNRR